MYHNMHMNMQKLLCGRERKYQIYVSVLVKFVTNNFTDDGTRSTTRTRGIDPLQFL